eukprot:8899135-Pyramimonas_sp.AAC.1
MCVYICAGTTRPTRALYNNMTAQSLPADLAQIYESQDAQGEVPHARAALGAWRCWAFWGTA